jgi:hypothetical protein
MLIRVRDLMEKDTSPLTVVPLTIQSKVGTCFQKYCYEHKLPPFVFSATHADRHLLLLSAVYYHVRHSLGAMLLPKIFEKRDVVATTATQTTALPQPTCIQNSSGAKICYFRQHQDQNKTDTHNVGG